MAAKVDIESISVAEHLVIEFAIDWYRLTNKNKPARATRTEIASADYLLRSAIVELLNVRKLNKEA